MAIAQLVQHQGKRIFILGLIALLTACGGGGGKKDSTPDAFSFTAVTNAAVTTEVTSSPITIAGINKEAAISVANGTYSVNDGAFVATPGTVTVGQTVKVKLSTAATTNTAKAATLTIGGVAGTFSVTTAPDITPNALVFTPTTAAALSSINSSTITLAGFDGALPISISAGGEYQIGSGAFTAAAGTATSGQVITVRATASASVSTAVSVTLTLGAVTGTYTVTTIPDTIAPTAQIMFPPAVSLSNGATVKVRGTASDANSAIASVTVNGVAAISTDSFATWTADVPLTLGANTLTVAVADSAANVSADAAHVSVQRVASLSGANFPDAANTIATPRAIVFDDTNNRLLFADYDHGIVAVDLASGTRSIFSSATIPNANNPLSSPAALVLDRANSRLIVSDTQNYSIMAINLTTGGRTVISSNTVPDTVNPFDNPRRMALDIANNRAYVLDRASSNRVFTVNLSTGARTVLMNNDPLFFEPSDIVFDSTNNRVLVGENLNRSIVAVSLAGASSVLSDDSTPNAINPLVGVGGIALDSAANRLIVADLADGIIAVNLTTGARTVLSNASTPNSRNIFSTAASLALNMPQKLAYVLDRDILAVFGVDLVTGERVIISK